MTRAMLIVSAITVYLYVAVGVDQWIRAKKAKPR